MRALSANDVMRAWEMGRQKHSVDRALILLALALPSLSLSRLGTLTLGQRNARLLYLRQQTLGPDAACLVKCPSCGERLEFSLDTRTLLPAGNNGALELESEAIPEAGSMGESSTLVIDTYHLSFRLLTSVDLAAAQQCIDAQEAYYRLIERCIVKAMHHEQAVQVESLPEDVLQALAEAVLANDPLAEITLALDCSTCKHTWTTMFDIATFFWTELDALAKRLLRDVHTIASAYGWRESDILALSATRRQYYLELIR